MLCFSIDNVLYFLFWVHGQTLFFLWKIYASYAFFLQCHNLIFSAMSLSRMNYQRLNVVSIYISVCVSVCVCVYLGGGISTGLMSCFTNSRKESCSWIVIHFAATLQYRQTKNAILSCRQIDKSFIFTNIVYKQLFLTTRVVLKADMVRHGLKIDLFLCFGPFSYWFGISQTKELVRVSISESN